MKFLAPVNPLSTTVILYTQTQEILLLLRDDMPLWEVTGGLVDPGESLEQAGAREVFEEIGWELPLERHVGDYQSLYVENGKPTVRTRRAYATRFEGEPKHLEQQISWKRFSINTLPQNLAPYHTQCILDALANQPPVYRQCNFIERVPHLMDLNHEDMLDLGFWAAHPAVLARKDEGTLTYWPF